FLQGHTFMSHPSIRSVSGGNTKSTVGTVGSASGLHVVREDLFDGFRRTVVRLKDVDIAVIDHTTNGCFGGVKLYDFPEGAIVVHSATSNLSFELSHTGGVSATAALKHAVGSALEASNDTLDSTQANMIPSTSVTLSAGAGSKSGMSTSAAHLDGRSSAASAYLNLGIVDGAVTDDEDDVVTVNGDIVLLWTPVGDAQAD
ncbi:MAG: hypothetical protein AB7F99_19105, partial [Vicinamibacterales bacterium]